MAEFYCNLLTANQLIAAQKKLTKKILGKKDPRTLLSQGTGVMELPLEQIYLKSPAGVKEGGRRFEVGIGRGKLNKNSAVLLYFIT